MRLSRFVGASIPRSILAGLVLFSAMTTASAVLPRSVVACSCMQPQPMVAVRGDPLQQIFVGTVSSTGAPGVDVAVERWFQGGSAQFVSLLPDGFGDQSAACQDPWPPIGTRWIWVAYLSEAGARPGVNSCTAKARLDTPEGAAMLAEAETAFGAGRTLEPESPSPESPPSPTSDNAAALVAPVVAIGLIAVVVFGTAGILARKRSRSG